MNLSEYAWKFKHKLYNIMSLSRENPSESYTCDNHHLFTAHLFNIFRLRGEEVPIAWQSGYSDFLHDCQHFGLPARFPTRKGPGNDISHDELIGIGYILWASDTVLRFNLFSYGKRNHWCFNIAEPGKFSWNYWCGRILDFPVFAEATCTPANVKFSWWKQAKWAVNVMLAANNPPEDTDGKQWRFIQFGPMRGRGKISDFAIKYFLKKMKEQYPKGVKGMLEVYFGPDHPIPLYCPEDIQ